MTLTWPDIATLILVRMEWAILAYFVLVHSFYAMLLLSATWEMLRYVRQVRWENHGWLLGSQIAPRISILVPAYNEAAAISDNVQALLALYYPDLEVVVINDGSTDATLGVLAEHFVLVSVHPIYRRQLTTKPLRGLYHSRSYPNLLVVDKENGGKADALNLGLQLATGDLVCTIDADTLVEPDALLRMVRPFLMGEDVLATGGTIRVVNGSQVHGGQVVVSKAPLRALAGFQTVEYLRAFLFGRLGWNRLGGNLIISGAFGLFRREVVLAVGGYTHDTVGEDMELVLRLRRQGYENQGLHRVAFIPDPVAWTEVPESLRVLGYQRDRWHRGLADALWRHRRLLGNPGYGALGLVVYPYFVGVELLAPVVEALGLFGLLLGLVLGAINLPFAGLFCLVAYGYGLVLTVLTLALGEWSFHRYNRLRDWLVLLLWAGLENFGYRQLTVFWRLRGLGKFLCRRTDWGAMEHRGFQSMAGGIRGGPHTLQWCVAGVLFLGLSLGVTPMSTAEIVLQQPVPPEIQEIELVYVGQRPPTVSLKAATTTPPAPPVRPTSTLVDLLALVTEVWAFGGCEAHTERAPGLLTTHIHASDQNRCGYLLSFQRQGLDVLSYSTLHLRGVTTGRITLALVDEAAQRRETNVPLTSVTGRFDLRVSLEPAARYLDLRRLVALVVLSEAKDNKVMFDTLALERRTLLQPRAPELGFWVWEYRQALAHPAVVLETCRRYECHRLLIQMPALEESAALWTAYVQFLGTAQSMGIEVFALDGSPEAIYASEPLLDKVRHLLALMADKHLAGVQLDIEPYLLEDFFADETGMVRYLAVLEQVHEALAGRARLSVAMPFWFTSQLLRGRPLAFMVMDRADEVAVMSYRTDMNELRAIAEDTLRYGEVTGVPVWLAVETRALPLERHVVLQRESRHDLADAYLDQTARRLVLEPPPPVDGLAWFRVRHRLTVWPERLTFAGKMRPAVTAAVTAIRNTVAHRSLTGVLIHDLNGFMALPE